MKSIQTREHQAIGMVVCLVNRQPFMDHTYKKWSSDRPPPRESGSVCRVKRKSKQQQQLKVKQ